MCVCGGLLQSTILESVGCIWFNRTESKDREVVAKKYVQITTDTLTNTTKSIRYLFVNIVNIFVICTCPFSD